MRPGQQKAQTAALVPAVAPRDILGVVTAQVGLPDLLRDSHARSDGLDREFTSDEQLWESLLMERVPPTSVVRLCGFSLSEWIPLRPGVFHTDEGRFQREQASRFPTVGADANRSAIRAFERAVGRGVRPDLVERLDEAVRVYPPGGKASLLRGGLGCVRLREKRVNGEEVWFLGATSGRAAHEGFVVAIPSPVYASVINDIRGNGAVKCDITGRLRFLPSEVDPLFTQMRGVPRMYLSVQELQIISDAHDEAFVATGAVTVRTLQQTHTEHHARTAAVERLGAAFVTFRTGDAAYVRAASDWLEEVYVRGVMAGTVVTDFDEQVPRFSDATFSLSAVFTREVDVDAASDVLEACNAPSSLQRDLLSKVSSSDA